MTYRELLKLYKTGKLDEEARLKVEAEIEKQDAISEYLFEEAEIPAADSILLESHSPNDTRDSGEPPHTALSKNDASTKDADAAEFVSMIQKSIRRAFIKMGIAVGGVVLAVVLCAVFLLPRAVSLFFYDPSSIVGKSETYEGMTTNRMSLDMAVYSELFLPGRFRDNVIAESQGYGKYDITIVQNSSFNGKFTDVNGKLERGKLTLYNTNVLKRPVDNAFLLPENVKGSSNILHEDENGNVTGPVGAAGTAEEALESLNSLVENEYYLAYVSLTDITDYTSVYQWFEEKNIPYGMMWYAVYAEDMNGYFIRPNIGFTAHPSGMCLDWDREEYPLLSLLDNSNEDREADPGDAAQMQTHFISLLNYLEAHDDILKMMSGDPIEYIQTQDMIRYVEDNGLQIYGFAIGATREDLLELSKDPAVSYIYTTELT